MPERVKVRAPTLANIQAVKHMLKDRFLADMPIVVAAIDPCFSCTDRLVLVHEADRGSNEILTWEDLRVRGIEHYKAQGVDFTGLNKDLRKRMKDN